MGKSLERQAIELVGKNWSKASQTRLKLLCNVKEFARYVERRYGLERIENLKPGMVAAYVDDLRGRGRSASTVAGKLTALRVVAGAIGKQNIVHRTNEEYGIGRVRVNPQEIDRAKINQIHTTLKEQARVGNRIAKMMVAADALRQAYGLRAKEALMSKDVLMKEGKPYLIVEGAKGGRSRHLQIRTDEQVCQSAFNFDPPSASNLDPPQAVVSDRFTSCFGS